MLAATTAAVANDHRKQAVGWAQEGGWDMRFARKLTVAGLLGLLALPVPALAGITAQDWGVTADDGRPASLYTLTNAKGMRVRITNYGGVIVSIEVPGRSGHLANVVQGFDSLADYTSADYINNNGHYGVDHRTLRQPHPRRKVTLDGKTYALDADKNGDMDQGGAMACFRQVFAATPHDGPTSLVLTHTDPDGFMGFPGTVKATVTYTLTRDNALAHRLSRHHRQEDRDQPDQPFLFQHGGRGAGPIDHQTLQIFAHHFTPIDATAFPPARSATWRAAISISRKARSWARAWRQPIRRSPSRRASTIIS